MARGLLTKLKSHSKKDHQLLLLTVEVLVIYFLLGFALKVGSASVGSSGHGCLGYFARMSLRTSA